MTTIMGNQIKFVNVNIFPDMMNVNSPTIKPMTMDSLSFKDKIKSTKILNISKVKQCLVRGLLLKTVQLKKAV